MLNLVFVSAAGPGGLLAFTAVTGYLAWLPISVVMTAVAWWMWSPRNRRAFLALAAGCLAVGSVIHFLPHTADGGVDGVGLMLTIVAVGVEGYLLVRLLRCEAG
jgi:hypothetical protein